MGFQKEWTTMTEVDFCHINLKFWLLKSEQELHCQTIKWPQERYSPSKTVKTLSEIIKPTHLLSHRSRNTWEPWVFADYIISTSHNKVISLYCLTEAARKSILILTLELRADWPQTCRTHPWWLSSKLSRVYGRVECILFVVISKKLYN